MTNTTARIDEGSDLETDSTPAASASGGCGNGGCGGGGCGGGAAPEAQTQVEETEPTATGGCGGNCGCGGHASTPVLDARSIDPQIRQSAIFGVLVGMPPRASVVVVAPHDPSPIVELLESRLPGEYSVEHEQVSGDEFRVTFTRV